MKRLCSDDLERVLASTTVGARNIEDSERGAIANYHRRLSDDRWAATLHTRNIDAGREVTLQTAGIGEENLREVLKGLGPASPGTAEQTRPLEASLRGNAHGELCSAHITRPPYTTGDPLLEEAGGEVTVLPGGAVVTGRRTYSQVASPRDGALSVGVALGKLPFGSGYMVYPPFLSRHRRRCGASTEAELR